MTNDTWDDVLFQPSNVQTRDGRLLGVMRRWERPLGWGSFWGIEAQALVHFGDQANLEVAAPLYLRSPRPSWRLLPAVSIGLGLSVAARVPEVEVDRRGESQRLLATWFFELDFGGMSRISPFLRLHHRSDAYGLAPVDTGSNAVLIGLRRHF